MRPGPTGTLAAFAAFYRQLTLTAEEAVLLDERRNAVVEAVHERCTELGTIGNVIGMGSSMRMTMLRPFDEIDVAIVFRVPDLLEVMRNYTPDTMIDGIAEAMAPIAAGVETWRGEAVRLTFDSPPAVDLLPAFTDDFVGGMAMLFPRVGTSWLRTNPVAFDRLFIARNAEVSGRLIPTTVFLKAWNRQAGSPFQSWILETILLRKAAHLSGHHAIDCAALFRGIATGLDPLLEMHSADDFTVLSTKMDESQRAQAIAAAAAAEQRAGDALYAEQAGDDASAVSIWQEVFGPAFPDSPPERPSRSLEIRPRQPEGFVAEMTGHAETADLLENTLPVDERQRFRCRFQRSDGQVIVIEGPMPTDDFLDRLRAFEDQTHDIDAIVRFVEHCQPNASVTVTNPPSASA